MIVRNVLALALVLLGGTRAGAQRRREVPAPVTARAAAPVAAPVATRADTQARAEPDTAPAGDVSVTLVTFGVGSEVWERFGHNALWIHDARLGTDVAYNWGLFDFGQPDFVKRFLTGDTKYWMAGEDAIRMLAAYHDIGRSITLQRLNLTPEQAGRLRDFVEWNSREENKYYRYDYFRDNCSTRLRDALDRALAGALRQATDSSPTTLTYRSESVRLTSGDAPVQAGIDIALGRRADAPLTAWESFFIPMRLRDAARGVTVPGPGGKPVPLVADERTIPAAPGPANAEEPAEAPSLTLRYLVIGVVLAAVMVLLRLAMRANRAAAWALSLLGSIWSLLGGVLGVVLLLAWLATRHVFWGANENLLLVSPLSLLLAVLLPVALLRSRAVGKARALATLIALLGAVALVLALVPGGQDSLAVVALFLPAHLALAWALFVPLPPPAPPEKKA